MGLGVLGKVSKNKFLNRVRRMDEVLIISGVLYEYRVFKEDAVLTTAASMTDEEACMLTVAGTTTWMSMNGQRPPGSPGGKGELVLIQGTGVLTAYRLLRLLVLLVLLFFPAPRTKANEVK